MLSPVCGAAFISRAHCSKGRKLWSWMKALPTSIPKTCARLSPAFSSEHLHWWLSLTPKRALSKKIGALSERIVSTGFAVREPVDWEGELIGYLPSLLSVRAVSMGGRNQRRLGTRIALRLGER